MNRFNYNRTDNEQVWLHQLIIFQARRSIQIPLISHRKEHENNNFKISQLPGAAK